MSGTKNPYIVDTPRWKAWDQGYRAAIVDAMEIVNGSTGDAPETPEDVNTGYAPEQAEEPKITRPVSYEGYEVTAVRRKAIGEFYADKKFNSIDWRTEYGEEVSMTPDGWKEFAHEIPHILRILGVDA